MSSLAKWRWVNTLGVVLLLASLATCLPRSNSEVLRRTEITEDDLLPSYDFIVIGGGQSGTVIATRLAEIPDVRVLVVEYGYFVDDPAYFAPTGGAIGIINSRYRFNLTSTPQAGLNGRSIGVLTAACAGGGSAINGMLLNRGSAADYNSWEALGNADWGWDGLYPYFIKSSRFYPPAQRAAEEYNMTWGEESYDDGPIHLSFSSWQYPGTAIQREAMIKAGAVPQVDGSGGNSFGVLWWPSAIDNSTAQRSYAVNGYYQPISTQENLHFLTGWRVDNIHFDDSKTATGVTITKRTDRGQSPKSLEVKATSEVVVTAGAVHTPQVLQRSGIGPKWLLDQAGIDVVVDLPGVGSNLQDHPVVSVAFTCELLTLYKSTPSSLTDTPRYIKYYAKP
jgi:choline dehydrogenase-like flavoprotein